MGIDHSRSPKDWRMRAEEFRAKADNCKHAQTREALRSVARRYDEPARSAEKFETAKKKE